MERLTGVQKFLMQREVEGYVMEASVIKMPEDIHIVLMGGSRPHIGAISVFQRGKKVESFQLEGHKEEAVSKRWAEQISLAYEGTVTVACGIHYDQATKSLIQEIVKQTDEVLEEVIQKLNGLSV